MSKIVNEAIIFATKYHDGQLRDSTHIPYILHPLEAGMIVAGIKEDDELIAAAILHDTLEDTSATVDDLRKLFSQRVIDLVMGDTENKREELPSELTWDIRKQETIDYLNNKATLDEKIVCMGDKLSNIRAIHRDYNTIGDKLWKRFSAPMNRQAWYYLSLIECFKDLKDTEAFKEYKYLAEDVFKDYI